MGIYRWPEGSPSQRVSNAESLIYNCLLGFHDKALDTLGLYSIASVQSMFHSGRRGDSAGSKVTHPPTAPEINRCRCGIKSPQTIGNQESSPWKSTCDQCGHGVVAAVAKHGGHRKNYLGIQNYLPLFWRSWAFLSPLNTPIVWFYTLN